MLNFLQTDCFVFRHIPFTVEKRFDICIVYQYNIYHHSDLGRDKDESYCSMILQGLQRCFQCSLEKFLDHQSFLLTRVELERSQSVG